MVVLSPRGDDAGVAGSVAEAVRRGAHLVVAAPASSLVGQHAQGRDVTLLPTDTHDQLATAVVMLELLDRLELGPRTDPDVVASALDDVAIACGPHRDIAVNPAKILALGIADTNPMLWGGTVLAARAARRIAEAIRRATGRAALAADAEHLLPVIEGTPPADVFADPFADEESVVRPSLVVLEDDGEDAIARETRGRLVTSAERQGVRIERISSQATGEVARYAALLATGSYAAAYLRVGHNFLGE